MIDQSVAETINIDFNKNANDEIEITEVKLENTARIHALDIYGSKSVMADIDLIRLVLLTEDDA